MKKVELSLEEKLQLLTGKNVWETEDFNGKLRSVFVSDGPHGIRNKDKNGEWIDAMVYPTHSSIANSWSKEVAYKIGSAVADECIENDIDVLLAPGVNIKRTALCGRNFEYFSEDPYLAGVLAGEYIKGLQDKGIGACIKHYMADNRELYRLAGSSEMDNRTMHEIYLEVFRIALQAEPWTIMGSYNPVNGIYACENKRILTDILRDELGYKGVVVSDWFAVNDRAKSLKAGLDLEMPHTSVSFDSLKKAYDAGYITMEDIDRSVNRIFELIEKCENSKEIRKVEIKKEDRYKNASILAEDCVVMLKNDGILPLRKSDKITIMRPTNEYFMGGGGSSSVPTKVPIRYLDETLTDLGYDAKYNFRVANEDTSDIRVICVGNGMSTEAEGNDRKSIKLDIWQENYIRNAAKQNPNVVVVVYTGSAIDVSGWIDDVKAVVQAGFNGYGSNEALAKILVGQVSPSGKLSETYPLCLEDTPTKDSVGTGYVESYDEKLFVGYRYFDHYKKDVAFPFGFGLSYAKFEYSDLKIDKHSETDYTVSYKITNLSDIDAKEVSQVYVADKLSMVTRPEKELKGFSKDLIKAGETKTISIDLDKYAFAYFSENLNDRYVENGKFVIMIGASSRDIRLSQEIEINLPFYEQYTFSKK